VQLPPVPGTSGTYGFRLTASDGQKSASDDVTVTLTAPAVAGGTPVVTIGGLADDQVVTKPVKITGTITEGAWAVQVREGGRDDNDNLYRTIASGVGAASGELATLDPTLLVNGVYTVRVVATTDTATTEESVAVAVDGSMKIGLFTVSFNDLEVSLGRLPITINRTYDSRQASALGDFGHGWRLSTSDVRVSKAGVAGKYWKHTLDTSGFFYQYCLVPAKASTVTFNMPGGKQYRFQPRATPECQSTVPVNYPDIEWVSTSHPGNPTVRLVADNQNGLVAPGGGNGGAVELMTASGDPWDPRGFTLTIEDGTKLDLELGKGLTRLEDRHGNAYVIDADGIHHNAGVDVLFHRDTSGRITEITDPGGKSLKYTYTASGDLSRVEERTGAATTFEYAASPEHLLTDYHDARGVRAVRNTYDADGRLVSTTDANGQTIVFEHDVSAQREVVRDRLGNPTTYEYDDRGNVTRTIDALGHTKEASYDAFDNVLTETDALGRVTAHSYDASFNRTSTTNALGHTRSTTYDPFGAALTETDELGHVTTHAYDFGNLAETVDPLGHVTRHGYNTRGERLTSTDARGFVTRYSYDSKHRVVMTRDPLGHQVQMTYDESGRETARYESKVPAPFGINLPPTVWLTGAMTTDPALLELDGLWSSDDGVPEGATYTYTWSVVSGPNDGVSLEGPNGGAFAKYRFVIRNGSAMGRGRRGEPTHRRASSIWTISPSPPGAAPRADLETGGALML